MKKRLEALEQENNDLKKTVFELSTGYARGQSGTFNIEKVLDYYGGNTHQPDPTHADISAATLAMEKGKRAEKEAHIDGDVSGVDDQRMLYFKHSLRQHTGAVYHVSYSPCGTMLASGSFDRTVKIWHMAGGEREHSAQSLNEHMGLVTEVAWCYNSEFLVSGSYDHQVKLWDVSREESLFSYELPAFVQSVMFEPNEVSIFFGGAGKEIYAFDKRQSGVTGTMTNDADVNTLYVFRTGNALLSGDRAGMIKTWDIRKQRILEEFSNGGEDRKPITHVHCSRPTREDSEGGFVAVNSYDNVLRVYKRTLGHVWSGKSGEEKTPEQVKRSKIRLLHELQGHRNQHWPIKSSFFHGADYEIGGLWHQESKAHKDSESSDDGADDKEMQSERQTMEESLILATGSAERPGSVYLFDVGGAAGSGELIQRLDGHTDRVNAVSFHPKHPVLATCSADKTVRIYTPTSKFSTGE